MTDQVQGTDESEVLGRPWWASGKVFIAILLFVVGLYGLGLNRHWRFQRDSAVYMGLARSMLEGRGYTFNHEPHTKYTPGFPAMLAGVGAVFGTPDTLSESFLPYNVLVTLLGLGCIGMFYLVLRELEVSPGVFAAAFVFFLFSRTLYYYSIHIMTDVPFCLFAMASLLLGSVMVRMEGWKSWAACAGAAVMIVIASSIRPVGPLLAVAVTVGIWVRRKGLRNWKINLGRTGILWGVLGVSLFFYSRWTHSLVAQEGHGKHYFRGKVTANRFFEFFEVLVEKLPAHFGGIADTLLGTDAGTLVGVILAGLMLVGLVKTLKRGERQFSAFALLLGGVIIAGGWDLGRRYLLPAAPVMCYWLALGGAATGAFLREKWEYWNSRRLRRLAWVGIGLVIAVNLLRIGDVILEQRGDFYGQIEKGKLASYEPIFGWLRNNVASQKVVTAYEATTIHYFTRVKTKWLPHDTRIRDAEWVQDWLVGVDFIVKDKTKPESTAAFDEFLPAGGFGLSRIQVDGEDQVRLFRVKRLDD